MTGESINLPGIVKNTFYIRKTQANFICSPDMGLTWLDVNPQTGSLSRQIEQAIKSGSSVLMIPEIPDELIKKSLVLFSLDNVPPVHVFPELPEINLFLVNERIKSDGTIEIALSEEEINRALKFLFNLESSHVFISLSNGLICNTHEKIFKNTLKGLGYKIQISSDSK